MYFLKEDRYVLETVEFWLNLGHSSGSHHRWRVSNILIFYIYSNTFSKYLIN